MLIEKKPGRRLYHIWDDLSLEHKKIVMERVANVLVELSRLKFNVIGNMMKGDAIGPPFYQVPIDEYREETAMSNKPFSPTLEYLQFFLELRSYGSGVFARVGDILKSHLSSVAASALLSPPFRLMHGGFDAQNFLFEVGTQGDDGYSSKFDPPRFSGIIDWEYEVTGPAYYLYEYPIFIQDDDHNKSAYADNAILRRHFLSKLIHSFPKGSKEREEVRMCMKKSYILNWFHDAFVQMGGLSKEQFAVLAGNFVNEAEEGTGAPYQGRPDYVPDEDVKGEY